MVITESPLSTLYFNLVASISFGTAIGSGEIHHGFFEFKVILTDVNDKSKSLCVVALLIKPIGLLSAGIDGTGGAEVRCVIGIGGGDGGGDILDFVISVIGIDAGIGGGEDGINGCVTLGDIDDGTGRADEIGELGKGGTMGGRGGADFANCALILVESCEAGTLLEMGCEEDEEDEEKERGTGGGGM